MIKLDYAYTGIPVQTYLEGALANASSNTGTVYRNGEVEAGVTVTFTNISTGLYFASFTTLGTDDDWSKEDHVTMFVTSTATNGVVDTRLKFDSLSYMGTVPATVIQGTTTDDETDELTIRCKVGEVGVEKTVTCTDAEDNNIDLTDFGDLVLVVEDRKGNDVQVVEMADLTISGDDNEQFTFVPNATILAQPGRYPWALRKVATSTPSGRKVIIEGDIEVAYSPDED